MNWLPNVRTNESMDEASSYFSKAKKKYIYICVFQVSRRYLGFCPDPKHFIVNYEQNVVKFARKWGKIY